MKILLALLLTAATASANAQLVLSFSGGDDLNVGPGTAGYSFTTGATPLTLAALGVWASSGSLVQSHAVGIWDSGQHLLAAADVTPANGTLQNGFSYVNITPLTLAANTLYVIASQYADVDFDQVRGNVPTVAMGGGVTLGNALLSSGTGFGYPDIDVSGANNGFFGPNAAFAPVPEPALGALFIAFLLTLLALYRHGLHQPN